MPSIFNSVPIRKYGRKLFDLSHENINSTDFGIARPVLVEECIPGDTHMINVESLVKLAPMKAPVFGRIDVSYQFFFIPNRLIDTKWEGFITSGTKGEVQDGTKATPVAAYFDFADLAAANLLTEGSLQDDMGLPTIPQTVSVGAFADMPPINAYPWLAYWKVWSDWFRDEQLATGSEFEPVDGGKISAVNLPKYCTHWMRNWKKDYFTIARPDVQLGNPVPVPLSGDIVANGPLYLKHNGSITSGNSQAVNLLGPSEDLGSSANPRYLTKAVTGTNNNAVSYGAGLSLDAAQILINNIREALAGQKWSELSMRGGNRYIESIFAHFNVRSSDARLQRSQYLGGKRFPVTVGEVLQTVNTADASATFGQGVGTLGQRGGVASSVGTSQTIKHFSEEHGWILCIQTVMPHAAYQQGVPRKLGHRWSRFQYAWPEFAHLGEQAVKNFEIFVDNDSHNDGDFGYQPQYSEYRWSPNEVHGEFRSSLNFWTTARIFASRPSLNESFIKLDGSAGSDGINRIFAVDEAAHFYTHMWFNIKVLRKLPKYGVPTL